jgi:hypothetical protein
MNRTILIVVVGLSVAQFSYDTIVRGQELSKRDATASEAVKVESRPVPTTVSVDVLKNMTVLFDGKSLDGWDYDPKAWSIVDGALRGTGKGGNIWTKGDYGSFRLILASRVASPPGDDGHNHLGVLFWGDRPAAGERARERDLRPLS